VKIVVVLRQPHPGRSGEQPSQEIALQALGDARLPHRDRATVIFARGPSQACPARSSSTIRRRLASRTGAVQFRPRFVEQELGEFLTCGVLSPRFT
jgi:hypothetical protein